MKLVFLLLPLFAHGDDKCIDISVERRVFNGDYAHFRITAKSSEGENYGTCRGKFGCCLSSMMCFNYYTADEQSIEFTMDSPESETVDLLLERFPSELILWGESSATSTTRVCLERADTAKTWKYVSSGRTGLENLYSF
ncbi:hypothetical protein DSO57_1016318 [Entomophthora muscae]|uniref:Uncharacterized protein n=1 Tax=Entomophthora muscae TaxID=34485 RepID=A0ACC2SU21_9FUNG|nr:hypothetical protein DSO57_1016318 [Entomophthora muscae]